MADTGILKEYLIEVGVRADTGALTKFANIISVIERMTVSLTAAMGAGVLAIEGLVYVATSELEDLYWATKRLKSSASDIQDFQLRMQKAGGSAGDARQALETLQQFRRTNPFGDQFLGIMGINAQGKGATQVLDALIVRFKQFQKQGQEYMAFNWGERLGFSYQQITTMLQTGTKAEHAYADAYKKLNINQRQALEDSHRYQNELRDFTATLDVTTKALGLKFLPVADRFMKWLQSPDAEQMGQSLFKLGAAIGKMAESGATLLGHMPPESLEFGVIGFFLFGKKGALLLGMMGAASTLLDKMSGDKNEVSAPNLKEYGESKGKAANRWLFDNGLGYLNTNEFNTTYAEYLERKKAGTLPKKPYAEPDKKSWSEWLGSMNSSGTVAVPFGKKKKLPLGVRSNNPGNLQPGGKEAVYATAADGLQDMAKTLLRYSRQGLTTIDSIIGKYAPEYGANGKRINDTAQYRHRVSKEMNVMGNANLNLNDAGVLQRLMTSMIRVEQGYMPYDRSLIARVAQGVLGASPAMASAPAMRKPNPNLSAPLAPGAAGTKHVTINQKTDVTIHGAKDPKETAKQVKRINDRTNGDLIRNFSPALR